MITTKPLAETIKEQFPSTMPGEDYESEYSFSVRLDFREWKQVISSLRSQEETVRKCAEICRNRAKILDEQNYYGAVASNQCAAEIESTFGLEPK